MRSSTLVDGEQVEVLVEGVYVVGSEFSMS